MQISRYTGATKKDSRKMVHKILFGKKVIFYPKMVAPPKQIISDKSVRWYQCIN